MTYALGRGVEYYDTPTVRAIARQAARDNYRMSSLDSCALFVKSDDPVSR